MIQTKNICFSYVEKLYKENQKVYEKKLKLKQKNQKISSSD